MVIQMIYFNPVFFSFHFSRGKHDKNSAGAVTLNVECE